MEDQSNEALWYVVHTYSGYENKVATDLQTMVENRRLQDLICDIKVPTEMVPEIKDGKERMVEHKLFPGYVLVKMVMNDDTWYVVRNTRGCTGFVGPASKPVPLTAEEVEKMGVEKAAPLSVDFAVGDTVPYLTNRGVKGDFEALKTPVVVKETEGKKAFHFDGSQLFRSSFSLPATLQDNAPYTLEAWVLNDSIAENECVADFTTSHDELEKIMLVNGTEPRCGVINHYGWYEDVGYKGMKELTGRWQHIYICFDGRMEQVYINGEQVSGKDIQLLVKPSQFVTLGRNAEGEWPFTGYLHSLKLWDEYIPLQGRK